MASNKELKVKTIALRIDENIHMKLKISTARSKISIKDYILALIKKADQGG